MVSINMSIRNLNTKQAEKALVLIKEVSGNKTALANIRDKAEDPFRILVSTILSARTRDQVTEKISDLLFLKYPDATSLSKARFTSVAKIIRPVNFYKGKDEKDNRGIKANRLRVWRGRPKNV